MIEFGPGLLAALRDLGRAFSSGYSQGRSGAAYLPFKPAEPAQEPEDDEPEAKPAPRPKKATKAKSAADKPKKKKPKRKAKKPEAEPASEPEAPKAVAAPEPPPAPKKAVPDSVKPPSADPKAKKAVTRYNKRKTARQTVDMKTCKPLEDNPDRLKCNSAAGTVVYKDRPERSTQTIDVKAGPT